MVACCTAARIDGPAPQRVKAGHIAIVLHDFSAGGSERIVIRLANHWASAGRRVTILCGQDAGPTRSLVAASITVIGVCPAVPRGPGSRLRLGRALAPLMKNLAPDLILAPGNFHVPILWSLRLWGGAVAPLVCKISNPLRKPGRPRWRQTLFGLSYRFLTQGVDHLVAMDRRFAEEAMRVTGRQVVPWAAEPNLGDTWAAPRADADGGAILCIGRLTTQKNFALALTAFAKVDAPRRLVVLGEGEEREPLEALVRDLGIGDRVSMPGHVADIGPYLAQAAALLCSSRYEGCPAVLVEALAAGVPIVSTACTPVLADLLAHPSFGRIAAAESQALASALAAVIKAGRPDPAVLEQALGRHRIGRSADHWLELLDGAVAAWRPRSQTRSRSAAIASDKAKTPHPTCA